MEKTKNTSIGFLSILTLIFITLRLLGIITWSWWWVLSPLWIPLAVGAALLFLFILIGALNEKWSGR